MKRLFSISFIVALAAATVSVAQDYRSGVGLMGGGTLGVSEGDEIAPSWGLRALFRYALLEELHLELGAGLVNFKDEGEYLGLANVETSLIPVDLRALITPWSEEAFSPYLYAGIGYVAFDVTEPPLDRTAEADTTGGTLTFPWGIGANYRLSLNWSLDFQFGNTLTLSDDLNPKYDDINDAWWSGMVGVIYAFGSPHTAEDDPEIPVIRRDVPFVLEGIQFETGSASIKPESEVILNRALRSLQTYPDVRVRIAGHTDSVGTDANNQRLSEQRAQSVKTWFQDRGISGTRMEAVGFGESRPRADNGTADGRALNRRIEIIRID